MTDPTTIDEFSRKYIKALNGRLSEGYREAFNSQLHNYIMELRANTKPHKESEKER